MKGGLNPCLYLLAAWDSRCHCIDRLCVLAANRILIARVTLGGKKILSVWRAARAPGKSHERQILNDMH